MTRKEASERAAELRANIEKHAQQNQVAAARASAERAKDANPRGIVRKSVEQATVPGLGAIEVVVFRAEWGTERFASSSEAEANAWIEKRRAAWGSTHAKGLGRQSIVAAIGRSLGVLGSQLAGAQATAVNRGMPKGMSLLTDDERAALKGAMDTLSALADRIGKEA